LNPKPAWLPYRRMLGRWSPVLLFTWFMCMNLLYIRPWQFAMDALIYQRAANVFVAGGDPWQAEHAGYLFAAAPPSMIPYLPLSVLPEQVSAAFWMGAGLAAAIYALRKLGLPLWWIAFPPLAQALFVGNGQPIVLALLLASARPLAALAPIVKLYAIPAMVGNWRALLLAGVVLGLSWFVLPWERYLVDMPTMLARLEAQALGGHSAYGDPIVFGAAIVALLLLRRRHGQWFIVPALWPATQFHYAVLALPAMRPLLAVGFAIPIPGLPALLVIGYALAVVAQEVKSGRLLRGANLPTVKRWALQAIPVRIRQLGGER
jgi:hypothetical protein